MKAFGLLAALMITSTLTACSTATTPAAPTEPVAENQVTVADRMYSPTTLTISVGDTVTWVFADRGMAHNVVADDNSFRSQLMETGQFTHTFGTAGTFTYHCTPHPDMTASIVVEP
ncbi:plastocyanin/azurin family copper-binding protein [Rhodococcus sp. 14-2483-1-2]|uniref:cupredoxin domain-containing protein n=1 Tax=Rhodococcus sp. 14-2483-1-2 TaxID=2023147 RepID=UPI00207B745C|nr:plastocyanin/azurin family copper-binding protein [Rhodococcus sp. 14-2483-1-2]